MRTTRRSRGKHGTTWRGGALAVGGILAVFVLWVSVYYDYPVAAMEAGYMVADYRAAGLPWEAKDLFSGPPVKPGENAAPLIRQAIELWPADAEAGATTKWAKAIGEGRCATVLQEMKPYGPALAMLAKAAERPRVDFGRDWDEGPFVDLSEYRPMKSMVLVCSLRADARAGTDDASGAMADLHAAWRLALLAGQEPVILSPLVRSSCERYVLSAVERCAATWADQPNRLSDLQTLLAEPHAAYDYPAALKGEIYVQIATLRNADVQALIPKDGSLKGLKKPLQRTGLPDSMKSKAYAYRLMSFWLEAKPFLSRYADDPLSLDEELAAHRDGYVEEKSLSNELNAVLLPAFSSKPIVEAQAALVATQALLAALQVRAKTGKMPTKIEDIPGKWIDPIAQSPLHIAQVGPTTRIYSIGPNRVDDGGKDAYDSKDFTTDDDVAAMYPPR